MRTHLSLFSRAARSFQPGPAGGFLLFRFSQVSLSAFCRPTNPRPRAWEQSPGSRRPRAGVPAPPRVLLPFRQVVKLGTKIQTLCLHPVTALPYGSRERKRGKGGDGTAQSSTQNATPGQPPAPRSPAAGPGGAAASPRAHRSNLGASNKCLLVSGGVGSVQSFIFTIAVTPAVWKPVAAGLRWYQIRRASPHLMLLEHQFLYFTGELRRML